MIVKKKMKGISTKKDELFGVFRRGGFSSKISFVDHFFETIKIRISIELLKSCLKIYLSTKFIVF